MWSQCVKAVGDWFSSCEESIMLHTLRSISFWDCVFCFLINLFLHPLHKLFFSLCIFSSEIERAEFKYGCQIASVCQKAKYCFYRPQLRILNSPVTIETYLKNRLSVLGWVSSIILASDLICHCSYDRWFCLDVGWKSELDGEVLFWVWNGPASSDMVSQSMEIFCLWSQHSSVSVTASHCIHLVIM